MDQVVRGRVQRMARLSLLAVLVATSPAGSQPSSQLSNAADDKVRLALSRTVGEVRYREASLREVLAHLQQWLGVDVRVEWARLLEAGVEGDEKITLTLKRVPEETLLRTVLEEFSDVALDYKIRDGALLISTREALQDPITLRTYGVRDLLRHAPELRRSPNEAAEQLEELAEVVVRIVEPDSWAANGGEGKIRLDAGTLIVENRPPVHARIQAVLSMLRVKPQADALLWPLNESLAPSADAEICAALERGLADVSYCGEPLNRVFDDLRERLGVNIHVQRQWLKDAGIDAETPIGLTVRGLPGERVLQLVLEAAGGADVDLGYEIRDGVLVISTCDALSTPMGLHAYPLSDLHKAISGVHSNDLGSAAGWAEELIDSIVQTVQPDSWADNGGRGTIQSFGGVLFTRNAPSVCRDVADLLRALRSMPRETHVQVTPRTTAPAADTAIETELRRVLPQFTIEKAPFWAVLDGLLDGLKANVYVHWPVLKEAGVERDTPIHMSVTHLPVGRVLQLVLDDVGGDIGLSAEVRDGVLEIATREQLGHRMELHVHRITDLQQWPGSARSDDPNTMERTAQRLIEAIVQTIEPDSWAENGGLGSLQPFDGVLVVRNGCWACPYVAGLLEAVRTTPRGGSRAVISAAVAPGESAPAPAALRRRLPPITYSGVPLRRVLDELRTLLGVNIHVCHDVWQKSEREPDSIVELNLTDATPEQVLGHLFGQRDKPLAIQVCARDGVILAATQRRFRPPLVTCVYDFSDLAADMRRSWDLTDPIVETIEPDSWADNGGLGTLSLFRDHLIVRNTEASQSRVAQHLAALRERKRERADPPDRP